MSEHSDELVSRPTPEDDRDSRDLREALAEHVASGEESIPLDQMEWDRMGAEDAEDVRLGEQAVSEHRASGEEATPLAQVADELGLSIEEAITDIVENDRLLLDRLGDVDGAGE